MNREETLGTPSIKIGARYQKILPPHKIYHVTVMVARSSHPPHVQLAAEVDPTQVITVAVSALLDLQLWRPVD